MKRRDFLAAVAGGVAGALCARFVRGTALADTAPTRPPPRYWILMVPPGGVDPIWTTDPKTRRSVATGVDVPYEPRQIVEAGGLRFGPHFAALAPRADRLGVLNGVLVKAANHYTGVEQLVRLRTSTTLRTPAAFDVIGAHRDGSQALAHVVLNSPLRQGLTTGFVGTGLKGEFGGDVDTFEVIDQLTAEDLGELTRILDRQIRTVQRRGDLTDKQRKVVDAMGQSRALFERLTTAPGFAGYKAQPELAAMRPEPLIRAMWLLEQDLATTVTVFLGGWAWDTHYNNTRRQSEANPKLVASVLAVLDALAARKNRHGTLADQTAVLVASEIGRFPYLNLGKGKDHFPQIPVMFSGPAFVSGRAFGVTGREMEALPISFDRGTPQPTGSRMLLDDFGATVLRVAGIEPEKYGLSGHELRFLHAT